MEQYPYLIAPLCYFTRFQRTTTGVQGIFQRVLPKSVVLKKERYFAWAQSIYLANLLASAGLLKAVGRSVDVAVIGSGIPFLGEQLYENGITAISIDPNENLASLVEKEIIPLNNQFITGEPTKLPLADSSVSLSASHNFMQKLPRIEEAKQAVYEMLRISRDYVILQITPKEHFYFGGDDAHKLALSTQDWYTLLTQVVDEYSKDSWQLKEIREVKIAHSVSARRPPIFVLEKGSHTQQKREYAGLKNSTKLTWFVQDEATLANAVSLARPLAAYIGLNTLDGSSLSLYMAGVMATDALDGIIARGMGPSPNGHHIDRIADHATECIAFIGFGFPVIPYIYIARDAAVDAILLTHNVEENCINRRNLFSRVGYGLVKTAAFTMTPVAPEAGSALAYASTAFSLERAAEVIKQIKK
jgi:ubiquinone/menaquinone biosynthesis C-methylase UbiE